MKLEHRRQRVLPVHLWRRRVLRSVGIAGVVITVMLAIGVLGYHFIGGIAWIDALLEAAMILGGMGPVAQMTNDGVKLFASVYALVSGIVLIATVGVLLTPWVHRMMHKFHAEPEDEDGKKKR